jgi:DNA-binding CsgD family transcriptional regulator
VAFLELSCGQAQAAWEALEPVAARIEASGRCDPALATILPDAVEALVELGDLGRAESLVARLEENGRRYERPSILSAAARNRALLLAARGEIGRAEEAAAEAVACAREELPLELGRALLVKGRIERRAGRRRQARESLGRALALFEALEAGLWAARARAELHRLGLRRGPSDALTATEERVAQLAASGLTNREIAQRLFISPKTVEANLARVYRKLGIHSRAELGARMGDREASGPT